MSVEIRYQYDTFELGQTYSEKIPRLHVVLTEVTHAENAGGTRKLTEHRVVREWTLDPSQEIHEETWDSTGERNPF